MKKMYFLEWTKRILVFTFLCTQSNTYSQKIATKVDSLLNEKYSNTAPGAVYLIAKGEQQLFKKAYGLSNLELEIPMVIHNVFEIGSLTKQFTAISILILVEQGKLKLDDTVSTHIPNYPNGNFITIHHLLTHTSGIKDFTRLKGLNKIAKADLTAKELVDFFKKEPLDFMPGEKFEYCNSGYILLGYIIELVTKKSYGEFVAETIFKTLNMTNSYYGNHRKVVPNRASGYSKKDNRYINSRYISFSIPFSSGALMSTVEDMFKWQKGVKNHILINEESTKKVFTNYRLNNGENIDYGYGWHIKTRNGIQIYEHGGSIFGFKSMGVYIPEEDIYILSLTNCGCNSPTKITQEIASMVADHLQ
ncbi:MAG: serine hydrolase domain-containing protein [Bacteroidota bacterium]